MRENKRKNAEKSYKQSVAPEHLRRRTFHTDGIGATFRSQLRAQY
jgi:hypothetical protein